MAQAKKTAATKTTATKTTATKTATKTASTKRTPSGFSDDERAAMKERAQEVKAARGRSKATAAADDAAAVLARIAEMDDADRTMAERIHAVVTASAPHLAPKLWYGMPAYAKDGKIVCFFQDAKKFKARYATLGFNDEAALDDGSMWPTAYALLALTKADEKRIAALVKQAAG